MSTPLVAREREGLYALLARSGIGLPAELQASFAARRVRVNAAPARTETEVTEGDELRIEQREYRIERSRRSGHLLVKPLAPPPIRIRGRRLVQCGYHKCLTMYFRKVFGKTLRHPFVRLGDFTHFFHRLDEFYRRCENFSLASISGHALELERFDDVLVTRFIRDPRDLLVSGYFYHRRSAETWCDLVDPEDSDWQVVNGHVPEALPRGQSLAQYLNQASAEAGLLAEIEFRQNHFDGMLAWPDDDARVQLFRYEELVGNEAEVYDRMFRFYGFPSLARFIGRHYARRYRAAKRATRSEHIRNASSGQWRQHFTPEVSRRFNSRYGELLERLGYSLD